MTTEAATTTSICDRCKFEVPSTGMVYWLIEISMRPLFEDHGDVALGSPKFCHPCASEIKAGLQDVLREQIRFF